VDAINTVFVTEYYHFLSFLVLTSLYLLIVNVEVIAAPDRTIRHIRTPWDSSIRGIGPAQGRVSVQHTRFVRDQHPCTRQDSNPAIPASERPQTEAWNRVTSGIGPKIIIRAKYLEITLTQPVPVAARSKA